MGRFFLSMEQFLPILEIHQKKSKPDYNRLKTMAKRRIEQDLKTRNFEARNGRIESNMLVKKQREQRHVLKGLGDCWQWKATRQCSKGNHCSFRHNTNVPNILLSQLLLQNILNRKMWKIQQKRKVPEAEARLGKSIACHARTIWKGACAIPFLWKVAFRECSLYKSAEVWKFGDKCSFAHRLVE